MKFIMAIFLFFTGSCFGVNLYYSEDFDRDIRQCFSYIQLSSHSALFSNATLKPKPTSGLSQNHKQTLSPKERIAISSFKKQKKS